MARTCACGDSLGPCPRCRNLIDDAEDRRDHGDELAERAAEHRYDQHVTGEAA